MVLSWVNAGDVATKLECGEFKLQSNCLLLCTFIVLSISAFVLTVERNVSRSRPFFLELTVVVAMLGYRTRSKNSPPFVQ